MEVMETRTQTNHRTINTWGGKARDEVCPCCWCQDARQQGRGCCAVATFAIADDPHDETPTEKIAVALRPCPSYVVFENAFVKYELFQSESPTLDPLP